jgi:hypothetical protein
MMGWRQGEGQVMDWWMSLGIWILVEEWGLDVCTSVLSLWRWFVIVQLTWPADTPSLASLEPNSPFSTLSISRYTWLALNALYELCCVASVSQTLKPEGKSNEQIFHELGPGDYMQNFHSALKLLNKPYQDPPAMTCNPQTIHHQELIESHSYCDPVVHFEPAYFASRE